MNTRKMRLKVIIRDRLFSLKTQGMRGAEMRTTQKAGNKLRGTISLVMTQVTRGEKGRRKRNTNIKRNIRKTSTRILKPKMKLEVVKSKKTLSNTLIDRS